jgi:hypothetical protein
MQVARGEIRASTMVPASDVEAATTIVQWFKDFVAQPHPMMTRSYGGSTAVCPFITSLLDLESGALSVTVDHTTDGADPDALVALMLREYVPFMREETSHLPKESEPLKSLAVILPGIRTCHESNLTIVHQILKDMLVPEGLMVGEFYPTYERGSVWNDAFTDVMKSPIPLFVLRRILIHDLLFLHEKKEYFIAYHERFGHRFQERSTAHSGGEHYLHTLYWKARQKFAL